ncbi:MAG: FtsW/RodA/SpoVE family cell cycle protein, partial [Desulfarculus sp.]|nr:FtsW/RodA/SpoVE family cell cycle protein [Desulfarculus sp.]
MAPAYRYATPSPEGGAAYASRLGDPWLLLAALTLVGIGLVMVFSSSSAIAEKRYLDAAYFLKHQAVHMTAGLILMVFLATRDVDSLRAFAWPLVIAVFAALVLVLIPGVGHRAGGAARWLRLGFFSLQPAELAKLALVLFLADFLAKRQADAKSLLGVFLPCLGLAL